MNSVFKIKNTQTGLFSTGGAYPHWNKNGKVWNRLATLNAHLAIVESSHNKYSDAVVVEYEFVEKAQHYIFDLIRATEDRKIAKEQARAAARQKWQKVHRRRAYEELKKEFETDK